MTITAQLVTNENGEAAKIVQDATRSKKTRETRGVLLKNIFFIANIIGRKRLDSHTPWKYLYSREQGLRELSAMKLVISVWSAHYSSFAAWFGKTDTKLSHFISVLSEQ